MTFQEMNLKDDVLLNIHHNNFSVPTEIQIKAIPELLNNQNIFGKSGTGTGKTASFVLPILNKIDSENKRIQAIIIAPTRELAKQIMDQVIKFTRKGQKIWSALLIGGDRLGDQIRQLRNSHIVIGTPGRIKDHIDRKTLRLDHAKIIILDEADEMLKMGFKSEIDSVFKNLKDNTQVGFFSATMNRNIAELANQYMKEYKLIEVNNQIQVNNNIENTFISTKGINKEQLLVKLFQQKKYNKTIIFTNTKSNTERIADNLKNIQVDSVVINGDKKQSHRSRAIKMFRDNKVDVIVATDVLARGIDVPNVSSVINYDISMEDEVFVHRIGRTGRNNQKGESISFIQNDSTMRQLKGITSKYKLTVSEFDPEELGMTREARTRNRSDNNRGGSFSRDRRDSGRNFSRSRSSEYGERKSGFSRDKKEGNFSFSSDWSEKSAGLNRDRSFTSRKDNPSFKPSKSRNDRKNFGKKYFERKKDKFN